MKKTLALLMLIVPTLVQAQGFEPAQDDPCGGASIISLERQPPQADPATQAKMESLAARLRQGHRACMDQLHARQEKDASLGIASKPRPAPSTPPAPQAAPAVCSVVAPSGQPCVQKLSEQLGTGGAADEVVYGNGCAAPIELSVFYKDGSRASSTVKAKSASTLSCNDCGGVQSIEVACR